jgi:hypothetical protein
VRERKRERGKGSAREGKESKRVTKRKIAKERKDWVDESKGESGRE